MRFLIAGLGSVGRRHLRNLRELGENDIILYRTYRSTLPDEELAGYQVEADLQAALACRPDAVIVANPTACHLDVAIPAAEAGCHLLVEKPVSNSMDRIGILQTLVEEHKLNVLIGYQYRFHPGLHEVARSLSAGAIGRPLSVHAHWGEYLPDWHPWEDYRTGYSASREQGGGVLLTLSHPLDYLGWLFGEIEAVWALVGSLGDLELDVEDTAVIGLRFRSGVLGSLYLDYNQRPAAHRVEIVGTGGTIRWDFSTGAVEVAGETSKQQAAGDSRSPDIFPAPSQSGGGKLVARNEMFLAEMRHFISVLQGLEEPICTLEDGLRAMRLALCALQSAQSGQLISL